MEEKDRKKTEKYQCEMFGKRFVGATVAKISLSGGSSEKILEWLDSPKNFIVMHGEVGTGKTYFCAAMLDALLSKYNHIRAFSERALMSKIRNKISQNSRGDYLEYLVSFCDEKIMIFDDIGSSGHTDWREEVLMELIDFRYREKLATIFTSNLDRQEFFDTYGKRIQSRLFAKQNIIIDTSTLPDYREQGH